MFGQQVQVGMPESLDPEVRSTRNSWLLVTAYSDQNIQVHVFVSGVDRCAKWCKTVPPPVNRSSA